MRHAGHHTDDTVVIGLTIPHTLSAEDKVEARERATRGQNSAANRSTPGLRVSLSTAGTFIASDLTTEERLERARQVAISIRQRIETRLLGRVRNLSIRVENNIVFLEGRCATFYTKQLAQHAALGVLEDEQLVNNIAVTIP
jgi:hypothetical protein